MSGIAQPARRRLVARDPASDPCVTGCEGSLNGSTYLTAPLSADCEIVASFAGDIETFTVTASAGPGAAIEPDGRQSVTEGDTLSFLLLPDAGHEIVAHHVLSQ